MGPYCTILSTDRRTAPAGAIGRTSGRNLADLAGIQGVRQKELIGWGLIVGLNGSGDTLNKIPFTSQSLQAMLGRMGVNIGGATIRTGHRRVMMAGNLPPLATQGITVSALARCRRLHFARPATFVISASFGQGRHAGA